MESCTDYRAVISGGIQGQYISAPQDNNVLRDYNNRLTLEHLHLWEL